MRNAQKGAGSKVPRAATAGLTLGAIGVVFGDIGTSPLYALQAVFGHLGLHLAVTPANVYGIISLIIWAVTLIVSIKYIGLVMRADNKGEGGMMALVALLKGRHTDAASAGSDTAVANATAKPIRRPLLYILLGLVGIALFYGDSTITPAISVLSAVEGLRSVSPDFGLIVVPLTLALLGGLFWVQQYGTGLIGKLFGPVMLVWFTVIGAVGGWHVWQHPGVLQALSPLAGWQFIVSQPPVAFLALGAVILAVTGAEALYADMGHFGRRPIARGWFFLVFPALALCYMGQGAVLLTGSVNNGPGSAAGAASPFMALFPADLRIGIVILATAATLIASQSVISGAFSLTRQAIQLGFLPRMRVVHTSVKETGQIYLPYINLIMFMVVTLLIVIFGSSAHLANAYGVAVSGTLAIDTLLFLALARTVWHRSVGFVTVLAAVFVTIDLTFVAATLPKLTTGGWFPILLSIGALIVLTTWIRGQAIVARERRSKEGPLQDFITHIRSLKPPLVRVPGYAVYIGHHHDLAPMALHAAVEKLHELHQTVVILNVRITTAAHVPEQERARVNNLAYDDGISQVQLTYGFHDRVDIPHALKALRHLSPELDFNPDQASYFISLSRVVPGKRHNLAGWRKSLYCLLARNSLSTSDYYKLPIERTIEMRSLIEL